MTMVACTIHCAHWPAHVSQLPLPAAFTPFPAAQRPGWQLDGMGVISSSAACHVAACQSRGLNSGSKHSGKAHAIWQHRLFTTILTMHQQMQRHHLGDRICKSKPVDLLLNTHHSLFDRSTSLPGQLSGLHVTSQS